MSREVGEYYNFGVGTEAKREQLGMDGAGLIWLITRDQLSPPVNIDPSAYGDPEAWLRATQQRIVELVDKLQVGPGELVAELGSGIGGPARLVEAALDVRVLSVNVSHKQLLSARELSRLQGSQSAEFGVNADAAALPFAAASLDGAYSINALYHVEDTQSVWRGLARTVKPGSRVAIDDWFVTDDVTEDNLAQIRNNWSTPPKGFHNYRFFLEQATEAGFCLVEEIDFTDNAGKFLDEQQFGQAYDEHFKKALVDAFPKLYNYQGYEPAHAVMAAEQLRADMLTMGELYRNGEAIYRQVVMKKGA